MSSLLPIKHALRVPRNSSEYRQLVKLLDQLADEVGEDEKHPRAHLMQAMGVLIEKFEDNHPVELV